MKNEIKKEEIKLPDGIAEAIICELAIGVISNDKIAKKYNVSPDTVTRYSRLFAERIGAIKKEIRRKIEGQTVEWGAEMAENMQSLSRDLLAEASLKKKRGKASLPQLVIALATLIDKVQLLTGGVTSRTETVKMTSKEELLRLLTDGNYEKQKVLEKSISFESAKNNLKDKNFEKNMKMTENEIKNILKNECDLIN